MTAQIAEVLVFEGVSHHMLATPLDDFFKWGGRNPGFQVNSTALWRGYVGSWEIVDQRLYLTSLSARLKSDAEASLGSVFPGFEDRVFAHWFSGTIRLPMGKLLQYVHSGFSSRYERDVFLEIKAGVLVSRSERHNGKADENAKEGYAIGAMTVMDLGTSKGSDA